jgi:hypothetical protein
MSMRRLKMADGRAEDPEFQAPTGPVTIRDRIAAFEMLDRMADATQAQKCLRLALVGFNRNEIAAMLMTTPAVVSQSLYAERQKTKRRTKN